jgi:hypothetical protein
MFTVTVLVRGEPSGARPESPQAVSPEASWRSLQKRKVGDTRPPQRCPERSTPFRRSGVDRMARDPGEKNVS